MQLAENKDIIHEKNCVIRQLRAEREASKLEFLTHRKRIEELEQLLDEKTEQLNNVKTAEEQYDIVLRSLQQDVKSKNEKILHLQSQIRTTEQKYDESVKQSETRCNQLRKGIEEIAALLDCEPVLENCLIKLTECLRTQSLYQTKITQKTDQIESFEFEQRAARETVLRLSGELNKEQQEKEALKAQVQSLQTVRPWCD
ncbi:unnamed protein product [Echinostoma caproni]|uniref:CC171 protein n=1 Tax=Echinostoma caproni TaxID=27848 RepID=A0A183B8Z9_9TREM|nr:unnamed protein product [Echinostoma caproni]